MESLCIRPRAPSIAYGDKRSRSETRFIMICYTHHMKIGILHFGESERNRSVDPTEPLAVPSRTAGLTKANFNLPS